ncbi:NAD(P)-binding protein [Candidatus Babeliales bacterium]|nr:NAD(P)-binding protein [Candidatus Babeliales bacterium]MCF7899137.1 NAD(P)-binding protein [Candidatus Babeliales bacterium]
MSKKKNILIIGAGPAGLTAASELSKIENSKIKILEKNSTIGGLSRTTEFNGCKFDIGPHHFITESQKIEKWWLELMREEEVRGNKFKQLTRFTRIYYKKHFFNYPLQAFNVIRGLSFLECFRSVLSYFWRKVNPIKNVKTFQDWVVNQFGYRLFNIFFKTYTEKLWGIPCNEISSDWASQRIKGFSMSKAVFYAFLGKWFKKNAPRTLCDKFYYPELGAGTLWNKVSDNFVKNSGQIILNEEVVSIEHKNSKILSISTCNTDKRDNKKMPPAARKLQSYPGDYFLSTMPLRQLILSLDPVAPKEVLSAANRLLYRALITVNFVVNKKNICPDHWLYIHDKDVDMVRIGNMNNFSSKMSTDNKHTALSLEYFTSYNSAFWKKPDNKLIKIAKLEIEKLGLIKREEILSGMILKEAQAYPIYDEDYQSNLSVVIDYLSNFSNLQLMGRNGMHRYNNMDIAMLSAMNAVDKILKDIEKSKKIIKNEENTFNSVQL